MIPETEFALLKRDVDDLKADLLKAEMLQAERMKLADARHDALMAELRQLQLVIASGQAFASGAKFTAGAVWTLVGGAVVGALTWLFQGGFK
jgi:uncharacterized membrane protein (DUF2068 family)